MADHLGVLVAAQHEHNARDVSEFHREKRGQRRQIFSLLCLGLLTCLLIFQVHMPAQVGVVASFGDLNVVWTRFSERAMAPFTSPADFQMNFDSLGYIIGATATLLIALVFSGSNPLGGSPSQVLALDELLELMTLLVGVAAAATVWLALHNVVFLPADPDSGPKFFLVLLGLMLVIFSVVRQRDSGEQREIDELHLTRFMRLHTARWERMWGVAAKNLTVVQAGKTLRLILWWCASGMIFTIIPMAFNSGFAPWLTTASSLALVLVALATAALTATAVSIYRSNPYSGVGMAYSFILLVVVVLAVVSPLSLAAAQNADVFGALWGYFLWLVPSLLLVFRKPRSIHMTRLGFMLSSHPRHRALRSLVYCFDGAREAAYWIELSLESRRQKRYETKLAKLKAEEAAAAANAVEPLDPPPHPDSVGAGGKAGAS